MVLKPSATAIPNSSPICWKASKKWILQANSKEISNIGYAVTALAGYVKFILKILDLYNVKSYTFVKLPNLTTISKKNILDRPM